MFLLLLFFLNGKKCLKLATTPLPKSVVVCVPVLNSCYAQPKLRQMQDFVVKKHYFPIKRGKVNVYLTLKKLGTDLKFFNYIFIEK